ncbi:MAG: nicotinamide mononucleotide transporter [Sphingomonas sp.]|nr:nicotinamide mononucleotide transporter [Sphingomonas sp.]
MIAAMMTAANLGARTTGWGFVVFTIGSVCWALIGLSTGQSNLLATNAFLTLVNLVGIWRWLGRQAKYQDGAQTAAKNSEQVAGPALFAATGVCGLTVNDRSGNPVGSCVEGLIDRGRITQRDRPR